MSQQPPPFPGQDRTGAAGTSRRRLSAPCQATMRTYDRNGVHVEQCDNCKGLFLDFGEFEHLNQLESQFIAHPPPAQYGGPQWGNRGRPPIPQAGLSGLFFSS